MPIGSSGDISIYVRWIGMGGGRLFDLSYPGPFFLFSISVINREFLDGDVSMNRRSRSCATPFWLKDSYATACKHSGPTICFLH